MDAVRRVGGETGELFEQLTGEHGPGPYSRRTGTVELRGADPSMLVVIALDEYTFAPSAGRYLWGNTITFQIVIGLKFFDRSFRPRTQISVDRTCIVAGIP